MTDRQLSFAHTWMSLLDNNPEYIYHQLYIKKNNSKDLGIEGYTTEEAKEIWDYIEDYISYKGD